MKNIIEALNWRYAVKKFSDKKIPEEKLDIILEALRLTPSSFGMQTWKFILVKNEEIREKLVAASWNQRQVADSSHLIVLARIDGVEEKDADKWINFLAEKQNMPSDKKAGFSEVLKGYLSSATPEAKVDWSAKQLYIALGNLMTTCAVEEIDACPMEGFNASQYDEILGLKEHGLKSVLACPIGYRSDDDPYQNLPKARFSKEDVFLEI